MFLVFEIPEYHPSGGLSDFRRVLLNKDDLKEYLLGLVLDEKERIIKCREFKMNEMKYKKENQSEASFEYAKEEYEEYFSTESIAKSTNISSIQLFSPESMEVYYMNLPPLS